MQGTVISVSFYRQIISLEFLEIFIKTLQLLYQPNSDPDCKQIVREFLEFLYDNKEGTTEVVLSLKDFEKNAIKNFAAHNQRLLQTSNLIYMMNKVVQTRRRYIFNETASVSSITSGSPTHRQP